jgi:hypothetical protein
VKEKKIEINTEESLGRIFKKESEANGNRRMKKFSFILSSESISREWHC